METATLAGGCFWCMEAVFKRLKGVTSVVSGYTGGTVKNPTYQDVCTGTTGHAEAIQIQFDPTIISFEVILQIFFHLHDPTTIDRQGNDIGPQYRSAIFYHSEKQLSVAKSVMKILGDERAYSKPIVTEVTPFTEFFAAEAYHNNYYEKNSYQPYCQYVIDPKIQKLMREYKDVLKEEYKKTV
jgi:peptide-methionine (S)-S-oxide reductase